MESETEGNEREREMVAISLYKGNLHKVADVPHRWPRPTPKISLKEFKILLHRRARALSRLGTSDFDVATDVATTSNPNPSPAPVLSSERNAASKAGDGNHVDNLCSNSGLMVEGDLKKGEGEKEEAREEGKEVDEISIEGKGCLRKLVENDNVLAVDGGKNDVDTVNDALAEVPVNKAAEVSYFKDLCCLCIFLTFIFQIDGDDCSMLIF